MADFDMTTIPELAAARLNAIADDTKQRGQTAFEQALADQRTLLTELLGPAKPLMDSTGKRVTKLADPPPKKPPAEPPAEPGEGSTDG